MSNFETGNFYKDTNALRDPNRNRFATSMRNTAHGTRTENGQYALNTSGDHLLDLYATIGALRTADRNRVETLFAEAWKEDPLLATKIVFYARDIREGLGERQTFRTLIKYMATHHPESLRPNIHLIWLYGRYDDLYELVGTPLETEMWQYVKKQLQEDIQNMSENKSVSLLAKWLKTADASSEKTKQLGIYTANKLGYKVYNYKRILRSLRKYIKVTEGLMSTKQWDKIEYSEVPSKAMHIYSNAFGRHDETRFNSYLESLSKGETKINASTLYPYELYEKYSDKYGWSIATREDPVVEAQWKALPNYVAPGTNAIVMADTSGSMRGRPMATSVSLAIYFAERNVGAYHNMFMTFDCHPVIQEIRGETFFQKIRNMRSINPRNTDLKAAFDRVLEIAINNHVPTEEMPKSIIVISDMEIDEASTGHSRWYNDIEEINRNWLFYDVVKKEYADHGYEIPNIIFWNVNSHNEVFHADSERKGVQLVSGSSPTVFKHVVEMIGMTPIEAMLKVINSERYSMITLSDK